MLKLSVIVLLLGGVLGWLAVFGGFHRELITLGPLGTWWLLVWGLVVIALAATPPIAAAIQRQLDRLSRLSTRAGLINSLLVAVGSTVYLYLTARAEHRQFFPYIHDEFSYLIQARQFAKNRLWMPGHPLGMFFDSFQLLTQPVYASAYFPGTAIVHLPGVWLGWPPFVTSLVVSGTVAGLFYRITTEIFDGVAGLLAVLLLLSDGLFRQQSILTLSHLPVLMFALLAMVAWLRWRATYRADWAITIGFFLGMAGITRPIDALSFAIPVAIGIMLVGWRHNLPPGTDRATTPRSYLKLKTIASLTIGLLPCVLLQLLLNHGITGNSLKTPFDAYANRQYPDTSYGFHLFDPHARPESNLPQLQMIYDRYRSLIRQHTPENILRDLLKNRLRFVVSQASPAPFPVLIFLLPLAPIGIACLKPHQRPPAAAILITLPIFLLLYGPYFLFLPSYALPTAPAVIVGILLGAKALTSPWPSARRFTTVGLTLFIAGLTIASLPNWWNRNSEDVFRADLLASVNQQLAKVPNRPAVVLFRFDPKRNIDEEPVYNVDVNWPDNAEVIRAHDLGPLNSEIFRYYAQQQPSRYFYRFDEASRTLEPLTGSSMTGNQP